MNNQPCCVCSAEGSRSWGDRRFCERHFQKALRSRASVWRSTTIGVVCALLWVLANLLLKAFFPVLLTEGAWSWVPWLFAALPVLVWLGIFLGLDAQEPEPKRFTFGLLLLGAIVATGVAQPVLNDLFRVREWLPRGANPLFQFAGYVLVLGLVQESLKYACVRLTIFCHPEFDEPTDGIVYGAMAGLGFALALNLDSLVGLSQFDPLSAALLGSVNAVGQGTFGALTGFFLGSTRFQKCPVWWMGAGLLLSATLNGLVQFLSRSLTRDGPHYQPEWGLVLVVLVAALVFGFLFLHVLSDQKKARSLGVQP